MGTEALIHTRSEPFLVGRILYLRPVCYRDLLSRTLICLLTPFSTINRQFNLEVVF